MATVFRISELKSRLDGWRTNRKSTHAEVSDPIPLDAVREQARVALDGNCDLSLLLQNFVIPQLLSAERSGDELVEGPDVPPYALMADPAIIDADVIAFVQLVLSQEAYKLSDVLDAYLKSGASVEAIYVNLLAPAARKLGAMWEEDSADFVAVTMGLWRIQEILRELTLRVPPQSRGAFGKRNALFAPMPGDQHSLGTHMVAECFQRAGWDADVLIAPTVSDLTAKLADAPFDLIGLTVSCDSSTASLSKLVKTIKAVSCNPRIRVMLGGAAILNQPDVIALCGADGTASDAIQALDVADKLVPHQMDRYDTLI